MRKQQGDVDRYTQTVESGLFNLRAQLGTTKSSCQLVSLKPINLPHGNLDSSSQQVDQPILIALNAAIPKRLHQWSDLSND